MHLQEFTLSFAKEMNAWEESFHNEWMAHKKTYIHGSSNTVMENYRIIDSDIKQRYLEIYKNIFAKYCTDRERKFGGPTGPLSAGIPTKYADIDVNTRFEILYKNKNRAEITYDVDRKILPRKILFIVLNSHDEWKIDSFKYLAYGSVKWINGII
jgi:hypothetical protein